MDIIERIESELAKAEPEVCDDTLSCVASATILRTRSLHWASISDAALQPAIAALKSIDVGIDPECEFVLDNILSGVAAAAWDAAMILAAEAMKISVDDLRALPEVDDPPEITDEQREACIRDCDIRKFFLR